MQDVTWKNLKCETRDQHWQRFEQCYLCDEVRSAYTNIRTDFYRHLKKEHEIKDEMCANCFVLEKNFDEDKKLLICTRCKQIGYCSRACQVAHWKKGHKEQCRCQGSE